MKIQEAKQAGSGDPLADDDDDDKLDKLSSIVSTLVVDQREVRFEPCFVSMQGELTLNSRR